MATGKLHIDHMIRDEWAHNLLDELYVLDHKNMNVDAQTLSLEEEMELESTYNQEVDKLIATFFEKYYIDEEVDRLQNYLLNITPGRLDSDKISIVKEILREAARRSCNHFLHTEESLNKAKKLNCLYIDKTEEGNIGKHHIELIFNSAEDMKLLDAMQECLEKEYLSVKRYAITGERLYSENYLLKYLDLVDKVEKKYFVDAEIDYWGTIANAWYGFESTKAFQKRILKEQDKRRKRKTQPKVLVAKAVALGLM